MGRRLSRRTLLGSSALTAITVLLTWLYIGRYVDSRAPPPPPPPPPLPFPIGDDRLAPAKPPGPTAVLRQGIYIGKTLPASARYPRPIDVFRGVPFAQSTAGDNRFRPPVLLDASADVFDAGVFGLVCPGPATDFDKRFAGEDCLNANVYRPALHAAGSGGRVRDDGEEARWAASHGGMPERKPAKTAQAGGKKTDKRDGEGDEKKLLPVVVYVHGGAFNAGSAMERNMASFVAWADEPLLAVSFNYRVGPLGFLPSALAAREGLLNLGLRDQHTLLEWVRDNIEAFGGDPENVSLMGVSAGAHSIGHHLMYYSQPSTPRPPFAKAILESGAATARAVFVPTHSRHLVQFREFLIACGAEGVPEEDVFAHLRTLPLDTILKAARTVWKKYEASVAWPFQPVVDGPYALTPNTTQARTFVASSHGSPNPEPENSATAAVVEEDPPAIPDLPIDAWRHGQHLRVPVLTGFNADEGAIFVPRRADTAAAFRAFFARLIPGLTDADLDELAALYPDPATDPDSPYARVPKGFGRQWARLSTAYGHYAYVCPVLQTAHFLSTPASGDGKGDERVPVYVYRFAATGPWGTTNHGDESALVAHDMGALGNLPGLQAAADGMNGAWARFAAAAPGAEGGLFVRWGGSDSHDDSHSRNSRRWGWGWGWGWDDPKADTLVTWPVFTSPFTSDEALGTVPASRPAKKTGETEGEIMIFAANNDERAHAADTGWKALFSFSHRNSGTPAVAAQLSDLERDACRFWWARVRLSEGLGLPLGEEVGLGEITV